MYWNYVRKSTVGWSIFNMYGFLLRIMDFNGGFFSMLQIVLEHGQNLNIVKFILSIIAMGFDIIFIVQHYVLYPKKNS